MNDAFHLEVVVAADVAGPKDFESLFDAVAEAFFDCDGLQNADVSADLRAHTLTFEMDVEGGREADALERALAAVRTTLHAAGGATPGWERHFRMLRQTVEASAAPFQA
ncbi:hypothetical protein ACRAWB_18200 [Leifsonia poae]|uniref:hypothetical protein n=1 Tax=Leifsonia poae TaxID=110933 RepID=UPI003D692914